MVDSAPPCRGDLILLVEDDAGIRDALCELLADSGYSPAAAADGHEAIRLLEGDGRAPCVVLLDLMMPGMNGWEFRRWLSTRPELSGVPVVLLSAHANLSAEARALDVAAFLRKPIDVNRMLDTVASFCPPSAA
ncbi:MAG: response regulator [Planctomycetes bacterium]|nr:response regulator [Planctomycetota bacterium]